MPEYLKIVLTQVQIIAKKPKPKLSGRMSCITQQVISHHTVLQLFLPTSPAYFTTSLPSLLLPSFTQLHPPLSIPGFG